MYFFLSSSLTHPPIILTSLWNDAIRPLVYVFHFAWVRTWNESESSSLFVRNYIPCCHSYGDNLQDLQQFSNHWRLLTRIPLLCCLPLNSFNFSHFFYIYVLFSLSWSFETKLRMKMSFLSSCVLEWGKWNPLEMSNELSLILIKSHNVFL